MKLNQFLFRKSHLVFLVFCVLVVLAFWLSYFSILLRQENFRMHIHGSLMILWCILLVVQPYLIRTKKRRAHQLLGKSSYLLVPLIACSTVDLFKYRVNKLSALSEIDVFFTASVLLALAVFLIFYGLAVYFRKNAPVHARYMLCTLFPLFTAVFDRIIYNYCGGWLHLFPKIGNETVVQPFGLLSGDVLLLALAVWDWRSHRRLDVFPLALLIHLGYHYSVMNFYKFSFWQEFSLWFYRI
ncbi:MAG: hypothetical protein QM791_02260 [Ferruginibacter sp.]